MIGISKGRSQRIIEYGDGFVERHTMLLDARCGFVAVPLEAHRTILTYVVCSVRLTILAFSCETRVSAKGSSAATAGYPTLAHSHATTSMMRVVSAFEPSAAIR